MKKEPSFKCNQTRDDYLRFMMFIDKVLFPNFGDVLSSLPADKLVPFIMTCVDFGMSINKNKKS